MNSKLTQLHPGVSVIIPVYNSEATLETLVARLEPVLKELADNYELILVNDASKDGSWNVIANICHHYCWVHGIDLMRNYGQHNALLCGIRAAKYDICVTIDDDLQNPPEEIHKLIDKLEQGFDVIYGPPEKESHGLFRDLASQITKIALQSAMGADTARYVSAFRVFRTQLRNAFADYKSPNVSIDVLLTWATTKFGHQHVRQDPRHYGVSNYTFSKLVRHSMNMMTGFSDIPLRMASVIGFVFMFFGIGVLIYVLVHYMTVGGKVPGFTFLASIVSVFSGVQLFVLGITGEYLARMHFRMMERPAYIVKNIAEDIEVDRDMSLS